MFDIYVLDMSFKMTNLRLQPLPSKSERHIVGNVELFTAEQFSPGGPHVGHTNLAIWDCSQWRRCIIDNIVATDGSSQNATRHLGLKCSEQNSASMRIHGTNDNIPAT